MDSLREDAAMAAPTPILLAPFILLLATMALAPMLAPRWWSRFYPAVALGLGAVTAAVYLLVYRDAASLGHAAHEYFSFIALVGSLYIVAGGIHIRAASGATPLANTLFLLAGALAANLLGTTGAAMVLIRPWLRMNRGRAATHHIVFFIFIVANVGGCLTPIGDPPLFLGFLQGVPFWWVTTKCWPMWSLAVGLLLAAFYILDRLQCARRGALPQIEPREPWQVTGWINLLFLAVIVAAVFIHHPTFLRETIMLAAAAGSYFGTRKSIHEQNAFSFHPVIEIAVLFAGIFATMIPALALLNQHAATLLGGEPSPAVFYWCTGGLSAVLDNAPTYLGFFNALLGLAGTTQTSILLSNESRHLLAISVGAVFFGAATYIGNGPNFLIKSIAEQRGISMPSFVGFIIRYSLPILLPVIIIVWLAFFRD
jgi:Na+/H+ antiporter NhaD/arsenite permease-like protein